MKNKAKMFRCKIGDKVHGPMDAKDLRKLPGFTLRSEVAPEDSDNWQPAYKAIDLPDYFNERPAEAGKVLDFGLQQAWADLAGGPTMNMAMPPAPEEPMKIRQVPTINLSEYTPSEGGESHDKLGLILSNLAAIFGRSGKWIAAVVAIAMTAILGYFIVQGRKPSIQMPEAVQTSYPTPIPVSAPAYSAPVVHSVKRHAVSHSRAHHKTTAKKSIKKTAKTHRTIKHH
jgi:hypothetical protein